MNRRSQLACNLTIFFRFPFSFSSDREDISNTRECSTAFPNTSIKGRQKYFATRHILDSLQSSRNLVPRAPCLSVNVSWCRPKDTWALGTRLEFSMFGNVIKQALSCLMYDISVVVTLSLSPLQKMSNLFRRGKSSE